MQNIFRIFLSYVEKFYLNLLFSHVTLAVDMRILSLCNRENKIHEFFF